VKSALCGLYPPVNLPIFNEGVFSSNGFSALPYVVFHRAVGGQKDIGTCFSGWNFYHASYGGNHDG
jgi:hypothetical protein